MLIFTNHARQQMAARQILDAWVERAIQQPERTAPDPDPALTRAWRGIPERGGRVLRVVFHRQGSDIVVVTAMFDRGARRWRP